MKLNREKNTISQLLFSSIILFQIFHYRICIVLVWSNSLSALSFSTHKAPLAARLVSPDSDDESLSNSAIQSGSSSICFCDSWNTNILFCFVVKQSCIIVTMKWPWLMMGSYSHGDNTSWWHHQMEAFSALLALCAGNSPVLGEFPAQNQWRGALMSFFFIRNKRLSKQSWGWWFETPSRPLWRHCNVIVYSIWLDPHILPLQTTGSIKPGLRTAVHQRSYLSSSSPKVAGLLSQ